MWCLKNGCPLSVPPRAHFCHPYLPKKYFGESWHQTTLTKKKLKSFDENWRWVDSPPGVNHLIWAILICKTTIIIIISPTPSELDINTGEEKHSENKNSTTTPQFSCPNLKMGCKWEGSQEEEHLKKHCQFEQGNCSHCEKRFLRKDLETHEMLVCIERPAACSKNCGWIGRKAGLNGHLENCPGPLYTKLNPTDGASLRLHLQ